MIDGAILLGVITIAGFLWGLHRDVANLRERMATLEGEMKVMQTALDNVLLVSLQDRHGK